MARTSSFLIALVLLVTGAAAQDKPTFAGTWKLASDADPYTVPQMIVVQDAKTMTVTSSTQIGELRTTFNLDGTEAKAPVDFNGSTFDRVTKAVWNGSKLMQTVTTHFGRRPYETRVAWSLNADGTLLVETTLAGGAPVTSKATYKKG